MTLRVVSMGSLWRVKRCPGHTATTVLNDGRPLWYSCLDVERCVLCSLRQFYSVVCYFLGILPLLCCFTFTQAGISVKLQHHFDEIREFWCPRYWGVSFSWLPALKNSMLGSLFRLPTLQMGFSVKSLMTLLERP